MLTLEWMLDHGKFDCLMDEHHTIVSADVVKVKRGRWISHEGYEECGSCNAKAMYHHNFCPNCGCRMEGE
jgi:hypothetical protein